LKKEKEKDRKMKPTSDDRSLSTEEVLAELQKDPAFVAAWELEEPKVILAANIARLRARRRMTQAQLAEAAGTRQPRIAEIERGDANPKYETLIRIARALGVGIEDLVRRDAMSTAHASARSAVAQLVFTVAEPAPWESASAATATRVSRHRSANDNFSLNA
jgi:transcriptional regulator with XRE-family HTH domain